MHEYADTKFQEVELSKREAYAFEGGTLENFPIGAFKIQFEEAAQANLNLTTEELFNLFKIEMWQGEAEDRTKSSDSEPISFRECT